MHSTQKNCLFTNFKDCVIKSNLSELIKKLVEKGIDENKLRENFSNNEMHNKICLLFNLMKIKDSYAKLVDSLKETNCPELVQRLRERDTINGNGNGSYRVFRQNDQPYNNPQTPDFDDVKLLNINVKISDEFKDSKDYNNTAFYGTRSIRRGTVLIINNAMFSDSSTSNYQERKGAKADTINLENLFKKMGGYNIKILKDLTVDRMKSAITDFAKFDHTKIADICFVIIMTHGKHINGQTVVSGIDSDIDRIYIPTSWIVEQFNNDNCNLFLNKPKIFIFQTCRGMKLDQSDNVGRTQTDGGAIPKYNRTYSDILIAYPTVLGFKAHRDIYEGSWFIQHICKVFMDHAHDSNVEVMLKKIDEVFRAIQSEYRTMQTLNFENIGFKNCFLNPGIYEQNGKTIRF